MLYADIEISLEFCVWAILGSYSCIKCTVERTLWWADVNTVGHKASTDLRTPKIFQTCQIKVLGVLSKAN